MAKGGVKRGRWIIAGGLLGFVLISAAVVARRSYGHREGSSITALEKRKSELVSERARQTEMIREGSSLSRIRPIAEQRLGMHTPSETQIVLLNRPAADASH
jgi:cell division protein FtsL